MSEERLFCFREKPGDGRALPENVVLERGCVLVRAFLEFKPYKTVKKGEYLLCYYDK